MCKFLKISRNTYYENIKINSEKVDDAHDEAIKIIFANSNGSYGKRSIKESLGKVGINMCLKRVSGAMERLELVSNYRKKSGKPKSAGTNDEDYENLVKQIFSGWKIHQVLVSDLTYVKVNGKHCYVCFITDLYNREIVGFSTGEFKTPELVLEAFKSIKFSLNNVSIFHTDRGMEFKNKQIKELLDSNNIRRSLSKPGTPQDNAVAETMFKTAKTTWVNNKEYSDIIELRNDIGEYVKWYNNLRCHSSLEYMSPVEYRLSTLTA